MADEYVVKKNPSLIDINVIEDIKAELQKLADDEWNEQVGASKGLEFAIEVIDKHIGKENNG